MKERLAQTWKCAVFAPDIHALDTAAADFVQRMRSEEKLAIEDMVTFLKFLQKRNACRNVFLCGDISAGFMFWRENLHFCKQ